MLRFEPEMAALTGWTAEKGLIGPDNEMGYGLHAALTAAFGSETVPRPFALIEGRNGKRQLLAYARDGAAALARARIEGEPAVGAMLGLYSADIKKLPERFAKGRHLAFRVRVRPVRRRSRKTERGARERDVFLIACDRLGPEAVIERRDIYRDWLAERLSGCAQFAHTEDDGPWVRMTSFCRSRVGRRDGNRKIRWIDGPDATLEGVLEVTDPDRFAALVARGVGRHRAFGFGMLLLRPAG